MAGHGMARFVGSYTLALGAAFSAEPTRMSSLFGMGESRWLAWYLGARDLVLGAGLLGASRPRPWLLARGLADASDAALMVGGLGSGRYNRRVLPLLGAAVGSSALSLGLARRLGKT